MIKFILITCSTINNPTAHPTLLITTFSFVYRNRLGDPWVQQTQRPRRNRKSEAVRSLVRENIVTPK